MPDSHRYRLIFENAHTASVIIDDAGKIVSLNPAAELLLEKSSRSAQGHELQDICPHLDVSALNATELSIDQRIIKRDILFERPNKVAASIDMIVTKAENDFILVELYRRDGNIETNQMKLGSLSRSENLLRGLAHEIKNPLGGIRGAAQLLEAEFENSDIHEFTKVIIDELSLIHI